MPAIAALRRAADDGCDVDIDGRRECAAPPAATSSAYGVCVVGVVGVVSMNGSGSCPGGRWCACASSNGLEARWSEDAEYDCGSALDAPGGAPGPPPGWRRSTDCVRRECRVVCGLHALRARRRRTKKSSREPTQASTRRTPRTLPTISAVDGLLSESGLEEGVDEGWAVEVAEGALEVDWGEVELRQSVAPD